MEIIKILTLDPPIALRGSGGQAFLLLLSDESPVSPESKMGSTKVQLQAVQFLWLFEVRQNRAILMPV